MPQVWRFHKRSAARLCQIILAAELAKIAREILRD
jgi:hypothetical protein